MWRKVILAHHVALHANFGWLFVRNISVANYKARELHLNFNFADRVYGIQFRIDFEVERAIHCLSECVCCWQADTHTLGLVVISQDSLEGKKRLG